MTPHQTTPTTIARVFLFAITIAAVCGCSRPTSPVARTMLDNSAESETSDLLELDDAAGTEIARHGPNHGLVDLRPGRTVRADRLFRIRFIPAGGEPEPWIEERGELVFQITGSAERNERVYAVESETYTPAGGTSLPPFETLFRQDRSGLFVFQEDLAPGPSVQSIAADAETERIGALVEAAIAAASVDAGRSHHYRQSAQRLLLKREQVLAIARSAGGELAIRPARRPGGPANGEITFLRYPLRPGSSWEGRPDFNVWTVEALERLTTPDGRFITARLSIVVLDSFGPNDRALTWWGRPGEVQRSYHFEQEATDENGNLLGLFEIDELFHLEDYVSGAS